jgi:hypothetical protein
MPDQRRLVRCTAKDVRQRIQTPARGLDLGVLREARAPVTCVSSEVFGPGVQIWVIGYRLSPPPPGAEFEAGFFLGHGSRTLLQLLDPRLDSCVG